jgi:hypothetical protein
MAAVLWSRERVKVNIEPLQNKKTISPKDAEAKVQKLRDDTKGPLNLAENHSVYEQMIIDYDKWAGFQMLEILGDPDNIMKNMKQFNDIAEFKNNLNKALTHLDKI